MRLLALTGVVLVALVGASTAEAHHLTSSPVINPSTGAVTDDAWAELIDRAVRPTTPNAVPQADVDKVTWRARMAGRIMPSLGVLGKISLGASAFALGWEIGGLAQPTVFNLIAGDVGTYSSGGSISPNWWYDADGDISHSSVWSNTGAGASWVLMPNPTSGPSDYISLPDGGFGNAEWNAAAPGIATATSALLLSQACCSGRTVTVAYRTHGAMVDSLDIEPMTSGEYSAYGGSKLTTTYNPPGDLGTSADKLAAGQELGGAGTQTEAEMATEEALCTEAGLSGCEPPPDTFVLPQPTINETYSAYIARLEALGWIGTATTTVTTVEHAGYGPEAPVRIIVTESGATTTRTIDPLAWPGTAVTVDKDSDLTIRYNPSTAPETAGETGATPGTGTGTPVTWPTTSVPAAPALDFTPLTDIDFGCKFPYGFLCYAVDFTEQFDVAADAPVFTFDMEMDVALGSFDLGTYEVDLNVMDAWMALWRDILSVVLVVGAIYFVATRMLGFKAGGDPGAAMDDVL